MIGLNVYPKRELFKEVSSLIIEYGTFIITENYHDKGIANRHKKVSTILTFM